MAATSVTEVVRKNPAACGLAVIISNDYKATPGLEHLSGTVKDGEKMNSAFQFLKFATVRQHNVTRGKLMQLLSDISRCPSYPTSYKCIAFVFSGHGLDANQLYMQDGSLITVGSIVESLLPKRAPQLGTIPKLFFIDACRGPSSGRVQEPLQKGGVDATLCVPPEGNFLIAYSTMPYYRSYQLKGEGGLWMKYLAEKLRTSNQSIQDILSETNQELMEVFQAPEFQQSMIQPGCISRLHGRLCLQPEGTAAPPRGQVPPILSRQMSGHYRLNVMYQDGVITKPELGDIEHRSEGGGVTGYTGIVKFQIVANGRKVEFRGHGDSKSAACEHAAQQAVTAIPSSGPCLPPGHPIGLSRTGGVASGYTAGGHTPTAGYGTAAYTPATSTPKPSRVIDPGEELAYLLSNGKLMLSQDEELARQLQEEENQQAKQATGLQQEGEKMAFDQDHQLALQLQKEQLMDLTIENQFGSTDLKEKLTHNIDEQEQEKQDLLLAQKLAERLAKGDSVNDLDSIPPSDLNSGLLTGELT